MTFPASLEGPSLSKSLPCSKSLPMNCGVSRPRTSSAYRTFRASNHPGKRYAALSIHQKGVSVNLFGTKLPLQSTAHGPDPSGYDAIDEFAETVPHACRDALHPARLFRLGRPGRLAASGLAA